MQVEWTPEGQSPIRLDQDPRWRLLRLGGHGAPDTQLQSLSTPTRNERLVLHAVAQPRIITLTCRIHGATPAAFQANRATLAGAFAPWPHNGSRARPGVLTVTLPDGSLRALRALPREGLAWPPGSQHGDATVDTLVLEAPDPFWYDPVPLTGHASLGDPGNLRFNATDELAFPAGFGSELPSASVTVTNPGGVRSFPVFTVPGPALNPAFRHGATGHLVAFNLTVPQGLTLEVTHGAQPDGSALAPTATLIDDLGGRTNILAALRPGARFWALAPGDNTVVFTADQAPDPPAVGHRFFRRHVAI